MRFWITCGPHLYASMLFCIVAGPYPPGAALKATLGLAGFLTAFFSLIALVEYIYQEVAADRTEIAHNEFSGEEFPPPPRRESSKTVRVDEETHAVTWPDATITTTLEERQEYIGQIF